MEIPKEAKAAIERLGRAQQRQRAREAREDQAQRKQDATEGRARRGALASAHRVLEWTAELAATGALAEVPDGIPIHQGLYETVTALPSGALEVHHRSKLGHGVRHRNVVDPEQLVRVLHPAIVRRIAERIDSGAIWNDTAKLATHASRSRHLR